MQITKIRFGLWQSITAVSLSPDRICKTRTRGCPRANNAVLALANPFISLLFCP
jgi:hypothetical protein